MISNLMRGLVQLTSRKLTATSISTHPAIVFAPHQDDETLGCGGSILMKRDKNVPVIVCYMTDGAARNQEKALVTEQKKIRRAEALEACRVLGVEDQDVHFFDYPDGSLDKHAEKAIKSVRKILDQYADHEIFIPYSEDGHVDHNATHRIVLRAIKQASATGLTIYEYPVWAWNGCPLAGCDVSSLYEFKYSVYSIIAFIKIFGFEVNRFVNISAVRDRKRLALDQHTSQIEASPYNGGHTLQDVDDGEWLACFFSKNEYFKRYRL